MMNNSTEANVGLDHLVSNNWSSFLISMILLSLALTSSLFSLCFLNIYLKKLHHILKMVLTVLSGYNFMCCTLSAIFLIFFRFQSFASIKISVKILTCLHLAGVSYEITPLIH